MKLFKGIISLAGAAAFALSGGMAAEAAEDDVKVALKLFGGQDIEAAIDRCRFSLWQDNRNPETDRYAYLFHTNMGANAYGGPARMKIGDTVHALYRLAEGGEQIDGLNSNYLFATEDREVRVHIELIDANLEGTRHVIEAADLTVVQKGKAPFVASASGMHGCAPDTQAKTTAAPVRQETEAATLPTGIPIGRETFLNDVNEIPAELHRLMGEQATDMCDVGGVAPWGGARYVINDHYLLWQIPCFTGAYQGSSVFAVSQNPPQGWGNLLMLPAPPGQEGSETLAAMNPEVQGPDGRIVTTELIRGAGDCGFRRIYRLTDGPGEVLEMELLEVREKNACDGNASDPAGWPLVYQLH